MNRPPCWPEGQPCPNSCAAALYERTVYNHQHLGGPWTGWRMAGRVLVSPDGDRITPERLRGILWREGLEKRRRGSAHAEKRVSRMTGRRPDRRTRPVRVDASVSAQRGSP